MSYSEKTNNRNSILIGSTQISSLPDDDLLRLADWLILNEEPVNKQSMMKIIGELANRLSDCDYDKGYGEGYEDGYQEAREEYKDL